MATDKTLNKLIINVLSQAQYDSITKKEDELYLTPDSTDEELNKKQDKTDDTLTTTSKEVVGAINELNTATMDLEEYIATSEEFLVDVLARFDANSKYLAGIEYSYVDPTPK